MRRTSVHSVYSVHSVHFLVALAAVLLGCTLCGCKKPPSPSAPSPPPGPRVLHFPDDVSLGDLQVRDWDSSETWKESLGPARGYVSVPAGKELLLSVDRPDWKPSVFQQLLEKVGFRFKRRLTPDLEPLSRLKPDDLQGINLDRAAINDNDLKHVGKLTGLRHLTLPQTFRWRNPPLPNVTNEGLKHLSGLTNIRRLDLGGCVMIEDSSLAHFSRYTSLEVLDLSVTQVTGTGLAHLANATRLKTLVLSDAVTDEGLRPLLQLPSLEGELKIGGRWGTNVTDKGLAYLRNLHRIKKLDITGPFEGHGLESLTELESLEELSLWFRNMEKKIDISPLKKMTRLRRMSVSYREVLIPAEALTDLEKALPNCQITWHPRFG